MSAVRMMISMERLNVMISNRAKKIIVDYQKRHDIKNLDVATEQLLLNVEEYVSQR